MKKLEVTLSQHWNTMATMTYKILRTCTQKASAIYGKMKQHLSSLSSSVSLNASYYIFGWLEEIWRAAKNFYFRLRKQH